MEERGEKSKQICKKPRLVLKGPDSVEWTYIANPSREHPRDPRPFAAWEQHALTSLACTEERQHGFTEEAAYRVLRLLGVDRRSLKLPLRENFQSEYFDRASTDKRADFFGAGFFPQTD